MRTDQASPPTGLAPPRVPFGPPPRSRRPWIGGDRRRDLARRGGGDGVHVAFRRGRGRACTRRCGSAGRGPLGHGGPTGGATRHRGAGTRGTARSSARRAGRLAPSSRSWSVPRSPTAGTSSGSQPWATIRTRRGRSWICSSGSRTRRRSTRPSRTASILRRGDQRLLHQEREPSLADRCCRSGGPGRSDAVSARADRRSGDRRSATVRVPVHRERRVPPVLALLDHGPGRRRRAHRGAVPAVTLR